MTTCDANNQMGRTRSVPKVLVEAVREVMIPQDGVRQARASVVALWAVVSIHHAYEAGHYQDPPKLLGLGLATAVLAVTLVALGRWERTGSRRAFSVFTFVTLIAWVGLFGLYMGTYNYLLKNFLFILDPAATPTLLALFPTEHIPPTDVFHEGSGALMALFAVWVALTWRQLAIQQRIRAGS